MSEPWLHVNYSRLFSLPLLTKELIEQSHSRRTYILRVIYAIILYGFALLQYNEITGGGTGGGFVNLGRGAAFFHMLVVVQLFAILMILPAITCGALTVEKEKDTLALLLLTKLSPMTIVFEKLLSRIFAMATYQLLSLPLFAIVYGIGGVEFSVMVEAIIGLIEVTFVVASISIVCSTWFRTTSEAFIMSYVLILVLSGCSQVFGGIFFVFNAMRMNHPEIYGPSVIQEVILIAFGAMLVCLFTGFCLLVAARTLVKRAFVSPRNILLEVFQYVDRFFNQLNNATTGGIILVSDRDELPLFHPISWRETRKRSLGTFRYQFRILMLLLTPLIFIIAAVLSEGRADFTSPFRGFPVFFWIVSLICLTIHSTGVIAAERIRQSLDVLLVAPLSSSEIVLEKLSGVRRLIKILTVPFAILVLFQAIWTGYVVQGSTLSQSSNFWLELFAASVAPLIFMPLIMWIGFYFGLRLRTQMQAILATFAVILAICLLPLMFARLLDANNELVYPGSSRWDRSPWLVCLSWLSPVQSVFSESIFAARSDFVTPQVNMMPQVNSDSTGAERIRWLLLTVHFVFYGFVLFRLRQIAIRSFSKVVHRTEPVAEKEPLAELSLLSAETSLLSLESANREWLQGEFATFSQNISRSVQWIGTTTIAILTAVRRFHDLRQPDERRIANSNFRKRRSTQYQRICQRNTGFRPTVVARIMRIAAKVRRWSC